MNKYLKSTIFRKALAAISGLFLVTFLLGHLAGNLQLFIPGVEGQTQFNKYALFMTTNPVVNVLSFLTYSSIILHILLTIFLVIQSRKARPVQYQVTSNNSDVTWSSNNMTFLGVIIMLFIIVHMRSFWYEMHFGEIPYQLLSDGTKLKDLHTITVSAFSNFWYSLFYVVCMFFLSMHLKHGIESSFQTVGIKFRKYQSIIKNGALSVAILIPLIFASIPTYLYIIQK